MAFREGDYRPFVRASIAALEQLEAATAPEIALAVPYVNITQVDPFTAERVGDNIMKELLASPRYTDPMGAFFAERPLVSFTRLEVKTEQQYGYAFNNIISLEFTVHKPDVVFSSEEYVGWRELLVEGAAFLLEYGWVSNPGALKNDLLNGIGFYDRDSGFVVQSRTSMLFCVVRYTVNLQGNGSLLFSMEGRTMGNLGLRQVSLGDELVQTFVSDTRTVGNPLQGWKQVQNTIDAAGEDSVRKAIQRRVANLDKAKGFSRGRQRFVRLGDVLDSLISPVLERMCGKIGYRRADLFLGRFNRRAGRTSDDYGGIELSGKSIGDFPIPVDVLRQTLTNLQIRGKLMRVESFIDQILSLTRGQARWSAGSFVPNVFPISREVPEDDGTVFFYAIADAGDGSDVFEGQGDEIPAEAITKQEVFARLADRSIPVLELGRATSIIKEFNFDINPEPLQRSIFAERQLQARKSAVQMVEQPDPRGIAGRANPAQIIPLSILQGTISLVGNFVFQLFSYVWIEFYNAYPISGIYNVRSRSDVIEAGNFTTVIELISEGIDPFNTRRRLSAGELREERRLAEERKKRIESERKKSK